MCNFRGRSVGPAAIWGKRGKNLSLWGYFGSKIEFPPTVLSLYSADLRGRSIFPLPNLGSLVTTVNVYIRVCAYAYGVALLVTCQSEEE